MKKGLFEEKGMSVIVFTLQLRNCDRVLGGVCDYASDVYSGICTLNNISR